MKTLSSLHRLLVTLGFFLASMTYLATSVLSAIGLDIVQEIRDAQGNVVLDTFDQPIFIIDH